MEALRIGIVFTPATMPKLPTAAWLSLMCLFKYSIESGRLFNAFHGMSARSTRFFSYLTFKSYFSVCENSFLAPILLRIQFSTQIFSFPIYIKADNLDP